MGNNLQTTITNAKWKTRSNPYDPQAAGAQLVRYIDGLSGPAAQGLVSSYDTQGVISSPVSDGDTFTGTWAISATEIQEPDDREAEIVQTLTRVRTLEDGITKGTEYDSIVIDPFALKEGSDKTWRYTYSYLNPLTSATLADTVSITAPVGYAEKGRHLRVEAKGDRTATLTVELEKVAWTGTTASPVVTTWYGVASEKYQGYRRTQTYYGIAIADAAAAILALDVDDNSSSPKWRIASVTFRDGPKGSAVIVRVMQKRNEYAALTIDADALIAEKTYDIAINTEGGGASCVRYWPSLSTSDAALLVTALETTPTFTVGTVSYRMSKIRKPSDPETGLVTVTQYGKKLGYGFSSGGNAQGEWPFAAQWFETDDAKVGTGGGVAYRVTRGLKRTDSSDEAIAWANDSSTKPSLNNKGDLPLAGYWKQLENGLYEAVKENWQLVGVNAARLLFTNVDALVWTAGTGKAVT